MSERSEWVDWVGPARKGDAASIEKLEQYFAPFVHAVLLSRLSHKKSGTLVKPVLAETVFRLGGLSNDEGFGAWLLMAAREKAFEASKSPGVTIDVPGSDPLVNDGHGVLGKVRALTETSGERLLMRLLEGIAGGEIAQTVGGKEADVRSELERSAATLVQQLTGQPVSFAGDPYLWSLVGVPHPSLIPLENQLTALRYDASAHPNPKRAPEGRRQTGVGLLPLESDDLEENTAAIVLPTVEQLTMKVAPVSRTVPRPEVMTIKAPSVATDPANPFGTSVKTIHAPDLPAAADFADLKGTNPGGLASAFAQLAEADEGGSTQIQNLPPAVDLTGDVVMPTAIHASSAAITRPSGSKSRGKTVPIPIGHEGFDDATSVRPGGGGWKASALVGRPAPAKTIMGLPAVTVARGSVTRSWRPFGIAGIFALVAVGVALLLFDGTKRRVKSGWTLVPVVVASTDLTEGTLITIEMISTRSVPEGFVTSSVIKPDSTSYVVNQKILVGAQAGDPLLWSQFEVARSNERLSKKVMKRARAFDIMTSKAIAVGGWVQPNDRIDIIASLQTPGKGNSRVAITLLQDIPVLSTGKITTSTPNSAKRDGDKDYIDVSVLLLPEEVELVALATEIGELQFTLRTDDDHESLSDHRGTSSKTLLEGERVRLLQLKRMKTIQQIRTAKPP